MYNLYEAAAQFQDATFVVDVFTYVFVLLLFLIAAANVFNTISTNIKLRRRELAMLRSVGMAEGEFHRMLRFECLFYGDGPCCSVSRWPHSSPGSSNGVWHPASSWSTSPFSSPGPVSSSAQSACLPWFSLPRGMPPASSNRRTSWMPSETR